LTCCGSSCHSAMGAFGSRAVRLVASGLLVLPVQGTPLEGGTRELTEEGETTSSSTSRFYGRPRLTSISASCAAVEFMYAGDSKDLPYVYVFAKQAKDLDFSTQWGAGLRVLDVSKEPVILKPEEVPWEEEVPTDVKAKRFRILMRNLPSGSGFQVKLTDRKDAAFGGSGFSSASKSATSDNKGSASAAPSNLEIHRTDPRLNLRRPDGSVCVDLHWSHPHMKLSSLPDDVYFRIHYKYAGEDSVMYCEDIIGKRTRACGVPLDSVTTSMPSSFANVCGLRPKRRVTFTVEAFNCDGKSVSRSMAATTPPEAPSVTSSLLTKPERQGSSAGFTPNVVIDWIPQHSELITGHAIYLALKDLESVKLLCWAPHEGSKGGIVLPVKHKNHTHSKHAALLQDYLQRYHVHQEQQVLVATRTVGSLESPMSAFSLGDWLVMEESVKCLTNFAAEHPSYVSQPVTLSWTQEQSLSLYD